MSDATTLTPQNVTVGLHPLANDVPGDDGTGTVGSIDPATLRLTGQGAATDGKSLTVSGVGSWTVATDGTLSFDPEPGYLGTTSVAYRVTDSFGNIAGGTATVQVTPIVPMAHVDFGHTPFRTASLTVVTDNDQPGAASAPLLADSVRFVDSTATDGGRRLANANGVWTVDDQGRVGFVPAAGVSGKVSVGYRIADTNGTTANSTLTITVGAPPRADDDAVSTPQNENVSIFVLSDDLPGDDGFGGFGSLVADSVVFTANHDTELTTAQGTWTVNESGVVSFDPVPGFVGQAVTNYQVTDSFGNLSSAAITVTVTPITPSAFTDHGAGPARQAVTVAVLDNDQAGAASAPLRPGSVSIVAAAATAHGTQLLVDGQGTWTVNASGSITFTPLADFVGTTSAISYQVADANGTTATSTVTVTVGELLPHSSRHCHHRAGHDGHSGRAGQRCPRRQRRRHARQLRSGHAVPGPGLPVQHHLARRGRLDRPARRTSGVHPRAQLHRPCHPQLPGHRQLRQSGHRHCRLLRDPGGAHRVR